MSEPRPSCRRPATPDGDTGEPQSGHLVGTDNPTVQEKALLRRLSEEFGRPWN